MMFQKLKHSLVRRYLNEPLKKFHIHAVRMWQCFLRRLRHIRSNPGKLVESTLWIYKREIRVRIHHSGLLEIVQNLWSSPQVVAFKGEFHYCSVPLLLVYKHFSVENYRAVALNVNHQFKRVNLRRASTRSNIRRLMSHDL